jgi:pimeloyl-ACP methyl ester carboxylesterase
LSRSAFAIATSDGTPIFYSSSGAAEAASAVVLSDGIGCDGYVWKYLRRALAPSHHILHWHYRGHGRTPPPRDPARVAIADLADDLTAVLDDAGVDRAVLFGHSMGVQVVLESYRRHRARVAGMVLMCGAPGTPLRTFKGKNTLERLLPLVRRAVGLAPGLFNRVSRALVPTRLAYAVATRTEVNGRLLEQADFMPYLDGIARIDVPLFLAMLAEASRHSALDLLPHIDVPVLVVAGARDGFTPPELSHQMQQVIPGAELLEIEDGSHTAPLERPHLVDRVVLEFLARRVEAARPATSAGAA